MDNNEEKELFSSLRSYSASQRHIHLVALLKCRLAKVKDMLVTAGSVDEFRRVQGQAKELEHLLKGLTREALKEQHTGAFN